MQKLDVEMLVSSHEEKEKNCVYRKTLLSLLVMFPPS